MISLDGIRVGHGLPGLALVELPEALPDFGWWLFAFDFLEDWVLVLLAAGSLPPLPLGCCHRSLFIPGHRTVNRVKKMRGPATVQNQQAGDDQYDGEGQQGAGADEE
jgi:hypothetical protein